MKVNFKKLGNTHKKRLAQMSMLFLIFFYCSCQSSESTKQVIQKDTSSIPTKSIKTGLLKLIDSSKKHN